jgi:hypothetical protein
MDAKVEVATIYTVLTPGGGEMCRLPVSSGNIVPIRTLVRVEREEAGGSQKPGMYEAVFFEHIAEAQAVADAFNEKLRDIGIDDRFYTVVQRTITRVTGEWEGVPGQ